MNPYPVSLGDCKSGLVETLKTIKRLNGYKTELPDDNIKPDYQTAFVDDDTDSTYPKCCVVLDSGQNSLRPNEGAQSVVRFILFLFVKELQEQDTATTQIETLIEAVELAVSRGDLNGTVTSAYVKEFIVDGGIRKPHGCAVVIVEALRTNQ